MDTESQTQPPADAQVAPKRIVNPIALQNCSVHWGETASRVLDISFVRVVIEPGEAWSALPDNEVVPLEFHLDRNTFTASASVKGRGDGWVRLGFERMLPSSRSQLRSFLSPKKIGESLLEDWRTEHLRHFHGLNESELWFDPNGAVLFTYLDQLDSEAQFIIRLRDLKGTLTVGKILRKDYIELSAMDSELPLIPLSDREIYAKLSECRDIVTNFRPTGQMEYNLKQRLLKVISDTLYSTSHKVEMAQPRPPRVSSLPIDN